MALVRSLQRLGGLAAVGVLVPVLLAGCPTRPIKKVDPERVGETFNPFIQNLNRDIDILFLVDNSGSMSQEQVNLATKFPDFIDRLATLPGGLPNVHLGVVSTDLGSGPFSLQSCETANGDRGVLQNTPRRAGCTPPQGRFIKDVDSPTGRVRNYTGNLSDTFSCIAQLGTDGCGFEHQLESMKRALDGSATENAGFLRPGAFLAVIIISDEDDCSAKAPGSLFDPAQMDVASMLGPLTSFRCFDFGVACNPQLNRTMPGPRQNCVSNENSQFLEPVQKYIDFLVATKNGAKNKIIVAGIIGNPAPIEVGTDNQNNPALLPSCSSSNGEAAPGVRLSQFISAFGDNGTVVSICQNDFSPALRRIGDLIAAALGKQCIRADLVNVAGQSQCSNPNNPNVCVPVKDDPGGLEVECTVVDTRDFGTDIAIEQPLPLCNGSNKPCWEPVHNPTECPTSASPQNVELRIDRDGPPEGDVTAVVRCLARQ